MSRRPCLSCRRCWSTSSAYSSWWPEIVAVAKLSDDDALVVCRSALPYELELAPDRGAPGAGTCWRWPCRATWPASPGSTCLPIESGVPPGASSPSRSRRPAAAIRAASFLARPLLVWNHDRMLESCMRGLAARAQERSSAGR